MRGFSGRRRVWIGAIGLAVGLVIASGPAAGEDTAVTRARDVCVAPRGELGKREALEALKDTDSRDSRAALEYVVDHGDPKAATLALYTIGRANYSGAVRKLQAVFESTSQPHALRVAAFQAYARIAAAGGTSWDALERYLHAHASSGTQLEASCAAVRAILYRD